MLLTSDNDVVGVVLALRRILESADYAAWLRILDVAFTDFEALGLPRNATDRVVWQTCQAADVVLLTGNRSGGPDSLEQVINELSDPTSLPVLTLADPQRLLHDSAYAQDVAVKLLDFLERLDSLRGVGRLFLP
jgi:hypothetical protein